MAQTLYPKGLRAGESAPTEDMKQAGSLSLPSRGEHGTRALTQFAQGHLPVPEVGLETRSPDPQTKAVSPIPRGLCSLRHPSLGVPPLGPIRPSHLALHLTLQRFPGLCTMIPTSGDQGEALSTPPGTRQVLKRCWKRHLFFIVVILQSYVVGSPGNTVPFYRSKTAA